jgi:hypothetical protein
MVLPIGGVNIFAGFTSVQTTLEAIRPTQPSLGAKIAVEIRSRSTLSTEVSEYQIGWNPNLTLYILGKEIVVEDGSTYIRPPSRESLL